MINAPASPPAVATDAAALRCGAALDDGTFEEIRRRTLLEFCKWDPQVGDVSVLAPFPLYVAHRTWRELAALAEGLAAELADIEAKLLGRPELWRRLALPGRLARCLAGGGLAPEAGRVLRFDFHPTPDGWRFSEVNSDVPGGYTEASSFTRLMAEAAGGAPTGDPAGALADALAAGRDGSGPIALLSAAGHLADQEICHYLARRLGERDVEGVPVSMTELQWEGDRAQVHGRRVSAILRFYQIEWLAALPRQTNWPLLVTGRTPVANPASAALTESKRLPLVLDPLPVEAPLWRRLLPTTREPGAAPWRSDDGWLLKHAWGNTGEAVFHRRSTEKKRWRSLRWETLLSPRTWLAQERFEIVPVETPAGAMYPCLGVYTVGGRAAGIYGRLSRTAITDMHALDVAVLLPPEEEA